MITYTRYNTHTGRVICSGIVDFIPDETFSEPTSILEGVDLDPRTQYVDHNTRSPRNREPSLHQISGNQIIGLQPCTVTIAGPIGSPVNEQIRETFECLDDTLDLDGAIPGEYLLHIEFYTARWEDVDARITLT